MDFTFLEQDLVYKILTRKNGHLTSLHNAEFIMKNDDLEAYFDYPEVSEKRLIEIYDYFDTIVQFGKMLNSFEEYVPHQETLAIKADPTDGRRAIFLERKSA